MMRERTGGEGTNDSFREDKTERKEKRKQRRIKVFQIEKYVTGGWDEEHEIEKGMRYGKE